MDTWRLFPTAFALLITINLMPHEAFSGPNDMDAQVYDTSITMDKIRNELSEDGEWIKVNPEDIDAESVTDGSKDLDENLNTDYVWRPYNMGEDWTPYTNGYWKYTNCGWMWVSYYHWGWRPYHYGRWWYHPVWGWVWSPGYVWAPAWVVWMFYDGYCGWYPLSPRVRWHHHHGYRCHHVRYRVKHWRFCHYNGFTGITININVIVPPERNAEILKYSKFETGIEYTNGEVVTRGPDIKEVEKYAGKEFKPENVSKYNTSKEVREIEKKSYEESVKQSGPKTYQDKKTGNDEWMSKEDRGYENNKSREGRSAQKKQEDSGKNRNDGYNNEAPSEKKQNNDGYKYENSRDSYEKNDSYKNKAPSEKKQNNDSYKYENSRDSYETNDSYKYEAPKEKKQNNDSYKSESPKTNDPPKQNTGTNRNEGTKKNEGNKNKGNNDSSPKKDGKR